MIWCPQRLISSLISSSASNQYQNLLPILVVSLIGCCFSRSWIVSSVFPKSEVISRSAENVAWSFGCSRRSPGLAPIFASLFLSDITPTICSRPICRWLAAFWRSWWESGAPAMLTQFWTISRARFTKAMRSPIGNPNDILGMSSGQEKKNRCGAEFFLIVVRG